VQRRERDQPFDGRDHVVVDQRGLDEPLAAVHDPVPDCEHLDLPELRTVLLERVDDRAQRVLERRELPLVGVLLTVDLVCQPPGRLPDPLDGPRRG